MMSKRGSKAKDTIFVANILKENLINVSKPKKWIRQFNETIKTLEVLK